MFVWCDEPQLNFRRLERDLPSHSAPVFERHCLWSSMLLFGLSHVQYRQEGNVQNHFLNFWNDSSSYYYYLVCIHWRNNVFLYLMLRSLSGRPRDTWCLGRVYIEWRTFINRFILYVWTNVLQVFVKCETSYSCKKHDGLLAFECSLPENWTAS